MTNCPGVTSTAIKVSLANLGLPTRSRSALSPKQKASSGNATTRVKHMCSQGRTSCPTDRVLTSELDTTGARSITFNFTRLEPTLNSMKLSLSISILTTPLSTM